MRTRLLMILLIAVTIPLQAATIHVPQDQPTIQAGINAAVNGDTVLVAPGSYVESLVISGKSVTIRSSVGPEFTSLNSLDKVIFTNCSNSGIEGFRFLSGGTYAFDSGHHKVVNCRFLNIDPNGISLIFGDGSSVVKVSRCLITNYNDLAIFLQAQGCEVINNTIDGGNRAMAVYGQNSIIKNNIVVNMGFYATWDIFAGTVLNYNNFWNNHPNYGGNASAGPNDIHVDPQFVNSGIGNYSLSQYSPCINAGDPTPIYNDPDGSRNDMGAFPLFPGNSRKEVPSEYPTIQSAIDAAIDGDTVLVDDGHYYERVRMHGKNLSLVSFYVLDNDSIHIVSTIIDGDTAITPHDSDTGSVVWTGNGLGSLIAGFTIRGGIGTLHEKIPNVFERTGGGILFGQGTHMVKYCHIEENAADIGGGIGTLHVNPLGNVGLSNCLIKDNAGGAISAYNIEIRLDSCSVESNDGGMRFGGADCYVTGCNLSNLEIAGGQFLFECKNSRLTSCLFNAAGNCFLHSSDSKYVSLNILGSSTGLTFLRDSIDAGSITAGEDKSFLADSCQISSNIVLHNCVATINHSILRGNVSCAGSEQTIFSILNSTLCGGGIDQSTKRGVHTYLDSSVILTGGQPAIRCREDGAGSVHLHCSVIGGFDGPWLTGTPGVFDTSQLILDDPIFCDTASGDYRIKNSSPCAPANNSCGVLIGAYGIGCANLAPELTSTDSVQIIKRTPFVYHATSTDVDGPTAIYSFANLPAWLTSAGDSAYGTPGLNDSDVDIIAIISDGFLADSMVVHITLIETPLVDVLLVDGSISPLHLISNAPKIEWSYLDPPGSYPQTSFEIAVSTDNDWQFAEMWNPAPFASADTFVVYNGAPLLDGHTYWLRLRVSNSLGWSNWSQLTFRINSLPTPPQLRLPINNSIVASQFPNLTIRNPYDAESDSMFLTFEISADSFATSFFPFQAVPSNDSLTTVAVPVMLNENFRFWWRVKASDYYEESAYSPIWSFWINSSNTAPSSFSLLSPPNTQLPTLADNTPEFTWQPSQDFDPGDSVKFTLQISIDASFSFASQIPGLTNPHYIPTNPLEWGRRYWWRVKAEDHSSGVTWSNEIFSFTIMRLGDPDGNGIVTISDAVFLINYIFSGGPAPNPIASGDADCNGIVTISDAVYLINYIFAGGPPPCGI